MDFFSAYPMLLLHKAENRDQALLFSLRTPFLQESKDEPISNSASFRKESL